MSEIDLIGKRVVIALGGNALGTTPKELTKKVQATAHQIALMVKEGINVVVTHGNGPQVGIIDEAFSIASKDNASTIPFVPPAGLQCHEPGMYWCTTHRSSHE